MCDNWLVAVRTLSLSNRYRTNETDVSMITSERFSLWNDRQNAKVCDSKSNLSMNNNVIQGTN